MIHIDIYIGLYNLNPYRLNRYESLVFTDTLRVKKIFSLPRAYILYHLDDKFWMICLFLKSRNY